MTVSFGESVPLWRPPRTLTGSVFHYTSAAGLLGIVESRSLHATEAAGLNDRAEIVGGWGYLREAVAAKKHPRVGDQASILLAAQEAPSDPTDVFIVSASRRGDDANQWRLYGAEGHGFAVELDSEVQLTAVVSQLPVKFAGIGDAAPTWDPRTWAQASYASRIASVSPWHRVQYKNRHRRQTVGSVADWLDAAMTWAEARPSQPDPYLPVIFGIQGAAATVAHTIKAKGFRGEDEARIFVTLADADAVVSFRSASAGIVRYIALASSGPEGGSHGVVQHVPAQKRVPLPIRSVRLGPALDRRLGKAAVRALLRRHGYVDGQVEVTHSKVELR